MVCEPRSCIYDPPVGRPSSSFCGTHTPMMVDTTLTRFACEHAESEYDLTTRVPPAAGVVPRPVAASVVGVMDCNMSPAVPQ